jgi:hypothetical protein
MKSSTIYRHACRSIGLFVIQQISSAHVGAGMLIDPMYAPIDLLFYRIE